jgi:hypothetical protein
VRIGFPLHLSSIVFFINVTVLVDARLLVFRPVCVRGEKTSSFFDHIAISFVTPSLPCSVIYQQFFLLVHFRSSSSVCFSISLRFKFAFAFATFTFLFARVPGNSAKLYLVVQARRFFALPRVDVRIPGKVGFCFFGGMTTQGHNKEAATVSPVVSISSKYYEIQKGDNTNYDDNLLASLHQICAGV